MKKRQKQIIISFVTIAFILAFLGWYFFKPTGDIYEFRGNEFSYSEDRGVPQFEMNLFEENDSFDVYKVSFESRPLLDENTTIYGLLYIPKDNDNTPGLVFLSAGAMSKEGAQKRSSLIVRQGISVLTIDQRGIGETDGRYLAGQQDYDIFLKGKEPVQHLSVFDALRSYDVLKQIDGVDPENIGFAGESMGGRYAIIAAALEKKSKGALVISASGFDIPINPLMSGNSYMVSIDPDHYIGKISPNRFVMIQGNNDSITPLENAQQTFEKAKEPKRFFLIDGCEHGYCDLMKDDLIESLRYLFG